MNQHDKDILRFYGDSEEDAAQKELETAIVHDILGKKKSENIEYNDTQFIIALQSIATNEEAKVAYFKEKERERIKQLTYSSAKTYAIPKPKPQKK